MAAMLSGYVLFRLCPNGVWIGPEVDPLGLGVCAVASAPSTPPGGVPVTSAAVVGKWKPDGILLGEPTMVGSDDGPANGGVQTKRPGDVPATQHRTPLRLTATGEGFWCRNRPAFHTHARKVGWVQIKLLSD